MTAKVWRVDFTKMYYKMGIFEFLYKSSSYYDHT